MTKILLLGPRTNQKNSSLVGGSIVLFENLIEQCEKNKINFLIIDTNKDNYQNLLFAYLSIITQLAYHQRKYDHISLHSSRDYIVFGLIVVLIGKIFDKTTSLRKFGGEAADIYIRSNWIHKKILYFIYSRMNILFFEMKSLVTFFLNINPNTQWFPNVRRREFTPKLPRNFGKRFIFISHVKHEKGIDEILEASNYFDDSYTFDIYGPIFNDEYTPNDFKPFRANYKRPLAKEEVLNVLNTYDVLLLPSYKEGYPGIIIEAYSLGIPVIATTLPGIKEIANNYQNSILVAPKNVNELILAIQYFNEFNYSTMSASAYQKFNEFDADIQTQHYFKQISAIS